MQLITVAAMRALEAEAIAGGVSGEALMERAGRGAVGAVLAKWPDLAAAPARAVVLAGPGNNGGDGYVVARLLRDRGWRVQVLEASAARRPADAAANRDRWLALSGPVSELTEDVCMAEIAAADLVVEALLGIGQTREADAWIAMIAAALDARAAGRPRVASIDTPVGFCSESGRRLGETRLDVDLMVTFHTPKIGHFIGDAPEAIGEVAVADIGLREGAADGVPLMSGPQAFALADKRGGHKYDHGHALVLSGGFGKGGAARLAARGALRIGAGLVTLGARPSALLEHAAHLNAVMLTRIAGAEGLREVVSDSRITVVALGPGMGLVEETREMVLAALDGAGRAVLLDADALSVFADAPEALFAATSGRDVVLTPHMGEFARLFPDIADRLKGRPARAPAYSRIDAAREAAARAGCVVLLKGPDTIVAGPGADVMIVAAHYDDACPWLATAGAGDVLAGFVAGLLARGAPPLEAAAAGAWLHQECARAFGPGLIAEDLPEVLPRVLARLATRPPDGAQGAAGG